MQGKLKRLEAERQAGMEEVTDLYVKLSHLPIVEQERDDAIKREASLRTLADHLQEQLASAHSPRSHGGASRDGASGRPSTGAGGGGGTSSEGAVSGGKAASSAAELAAMQRQMEAARQALKAAQQGAMHEQDRAERATVCELTSVRHYSFCF